MLSLKSISLNKISEYITVNVMCTKAPDIISVEGGFRACSVSHRVEQYIPSLNLPHNLQEEIKSSVHKICYEVQIYDYYMSMCGVDFHLLNFISKLSFSMNGVIDYNLSAHKIVLDKNFDLRSRVILACTFCFEEEVLSFWKSHPNVLRKSAGKVRASMTLINWRKYLEGTQEPLEEFLWKDCAWLEDAFLAAVEDFNLEAAKYFLKKMTAMSDIERMNILQTAAALVQFDDHDHFEVLYFKSKIVLFLSTSKLRENYSYISKSEETKNDAKRLKLQIDEVVKKYKSNPYFGKEYNVFT